MQQFVGTWSNDDPEAALDWSLRNLSRIEPGQVLSNIGRSLARTNTDRARQALFRLPENYRAPWVSGVGRTLAENDLAAARTWAFEFPRGPLRDAALHEYVRRDAHGGGVDVELFDQFSNDSAREQAASQVAFGLACDGQTARAIEIASTQIADADMRGQSERQIEQYASSGPNSRVCRMMGR